MWPVLPRGGHVNGCSANILDCPMKVLLMAAWGEQGVVDRPSLRCVMGWRNGALSGSDLAHKPGVGPTWTYQHGEMPLPARPRPDLRSKHRASHQEMSSETASSCSQLKAAVPAKRPRVEEEMLTNKTMEHLNESKDELERVRKTLLRTEKDRDMWRSLFEDCNKKQGEEIERLMQEYKERPEGIRLATTKERSLPAGNFPRRQSPMELLMPRELSQTTEVQIPTAPGLSDNLASK